MRKREREITLLYGMSLIREDVLKHPVPATSGKDRALIFIHFLMNTASIAAIAMAAFILIFTFIPYRG